MTNGDETQIPWDNRLTLRFIRAMRRATPWIARQLVRFGDKRTVAEIIETVGSRHDEIEAILLESRS